MRARVQAQEKFLVGLELDHREWSRLKTQIVKKQAAASKQKLLRVRLDYGTDPNDRGGSDT